MASEKLNGDVAHSFVAPKPLLSEKAVADGLGYSPKDLNTLSLPRGSSSESVLGDGLLHRRKSTTKPRLPCFKGLGISLFDPQPVEVSHPEGVSYAAVEKRAADHSLQRPAAASSTQSSLRTGSTPLLTPPADLDSLKWSDSAIDRPPSGISGPHPTVVVPTNPSASEVKLTSLSENGAPAEKISLDTSGTGSDSHQETGNTSTTQSSRGGNEQRPWLDQSVGATVMSIDPSKPSSSTIQIVSQTLPNPAKEAARPNAIFAEVISAIQTRFGTSRQPYITITHAVPSRFDLLNLPSSPPSTPNVFVGREDYFTQSIFAHAAVVPSYHVTANSLATPAPSSPNPIVPPSSVQISVLERYIPPATSQECRHLFSLSGQSVLIDRLAELSPHQGSMLFVYPTKSGANTFISKYLNRILDPLLRSLVEVHQLSYGLAESLSSMAAIADMHGFDALKAKVSSLCRRMSHQITSETQRSNFHLVYASTGEVDIDRRTWTEWYLQQEHTRFKRTLDTYWGRGRRLSQMESASAGTVLREFIDGVNKMTSDEAGQTGSGIEVGVFVIRRTLVNSSS